MRRFFAPPRNVREGGGKALPLGCFPSLLCFLLEAGVGIDPGLSGRIGAGSFDRLLWRCSVAVAAVNVVVADDGGGVEANPTINNATLSNPPIPEPGTVGLLALGLGGLALASRRKN